MERLEHAAMECLLAGDHPYLVTLREQWSRATVTSRELTGVGFFVSFDVNASAPRIPVQ